MRTKGLIPTRHISAKSVTYATQGDAEGRIVIPLAFPVVSTQLDHFDVVRNQLLCGGCYAFAVSQALTDNMIEFLSENRYRADHQDILQTYSDVFQGCNGGQIAGEEVEQILATDGVQVVRTNKYSCDATCANDVDEKSLSKTHKLCATRYLLPMKDCYDSFSFNSCCWREPFEQRVRCNWYSSNNEQFVASQFVRRDKKYITSFAISLGFTQKDFELSEGFTPLKSVVTTKIQLPDGVFLNFKTAYNPLVDNQDDPIEYHGVTAIGWVTLDNNVAPGRAGRYWIIRNSWGRSWGSNGFALVAAHSVVPTDRRFLRNTGVVGGETKDDVEMFAGFPRDIKLDKRPSRKIRKYNRSVHLLHATYLRNHIITAVLGAFVLGIAYYTLVKKFVSIAK